jgi:hypothetical protein
VTKHNIGAQINVLSVELPGVVSLGAELDVEGIIYNGKDVNKTHAGQQGGLGTVPWHALGESYMLCRVASECATLYFCERPAHGLSYYSQVTQTMLWMGC